MAKRLVDNAAEVKAYLREEYRRTRKNYMTMISKDRQKYMIPKKDLQECVPPIPRIISDNALYKNAAVSRLEGALRKLEGAIARYKRKRSRWHTWDDETLRRYEAEIQKAMSEIPTFEGKNSYGERLEPFELQRGRIRAPDIWSQLKERILNTKRARSVAANRIRSRWDKVVSATIYFLYLWDSDQEREKARLKDAFRALITVIFQPDGSEDDKYLEVWSDTEQMLDELTNDDFEYVSYWY